ncbi:Protein of unknown function [Mesobacillus persicus]|uniref:Inner membrane protein YgaP-like transmembrane domain-containing protein n=1 Tax=Mesobacillus persicus TaxID=930146 RepID=A0A1H7Z7F4_9BACI|nr:DUF2892 domain-containing protein [Mesobacillus persicus]SEM54532.1 Protein of unknown function [Mesobacillus persicus]
MQFRSTFLPPTTTKVNRNTADSINDSIQEQTNLNLNDYKTKSKEEIQARLHKLDHEWDTERVLEVNFASIVLISSLYGLLGRKKWLVLSGIASVFMIQHALQGWCPPLAVIRRLKVRTAAEINLERNGLKELLED